jgi:anti-anti-sigma factor
VDANPAEANISLSQNESESVLRLRGSFQLELARPLHEAALQLASSGGNVVVDLSQAAHLDGCAVQVLLALKGALERAGGSLRMSGASQDVRKYLGWAGVAAQLGCEVGEPAPAARAGKRRRSARKRPV